MKRLLTLAFGLVALTAAAQDSLDGRRSGYSYMEAPTRALQDDDFQNPAFLLVDAGQSLWSQVEGSAGKSCASCHQDAETTMKGVAARYPVYDAKLGGLVNLEGRINQMRRDYMGAEEWAYESDNLLAMTAYVSLQSRGMPMQVDVSGPARPYFEQGKQFYYTKLGQLNLSCADCHEDLAGHHLRGDVISQGQVNGFPIYRLLWSDVGSRQRMFVWCNTSIRAEPYAEGSPEYLALELYAAWRGRGLAMESPAVRR
jgi:sulfur-oxidizing protein SoxA